MANDMYQYSGYTYYRLATPFGDLWLRPTSGTHIYADAIHNSLGNGPVRPEADRCAPLTVNRVEYGVSIHFYLWADGKWHVGMEFDNDGRTLNDYERRQALHMSKLHSKSYNDSHPSFSASDKVLAGVIGPINAWCEAHADVLRDAAAQDVIDEIRKRQAEIAEARASLQAKEQWIVELETQLAQLREGMVKAE